MNSRLKHRKPESRPSTDSSDASTKEAMYSGWSTTLAFIGRGGSGRQREEPPA